MSQTEGSRANIDRRRERDGRSNPPVKDSVFVIGGAGLLVTLCIALLLTIFAAIAFAQEHENESTAGRAAALPATGASALTASSFDPATLPSLDSIDAHTDVTVFLRSGVPAALQLAALRRVWSADPAIRDFKGMQENGWDFDRPDSIPGFGELGPEIDVKQMVARIFGDAPRLELARSTSLLRRRP